MATRVRLFLVGVAAAAVVTGCSGGSQAGTPSAPAARASATVTRQPPPDDGSRPPGVPPEAVLIRADRTFGGDPRTPAPDGHSPQLYVMGCKDGVLSVITSQIVQLYAELPCDRAVPQDVADRFAGQPVRLRLVFGDALKLYIDSPIAGTIEFTTTRAWVKE